MLLPDADTGTTGRATVASKAPSKTSNKPASVELANARESTLVGINGSATKVTVLSDAEVQAQFGSLLSSLPPAPQHFIALLPLRVRRADRREPRARSRHPAAR